MFELNHSMATNPRITVKNLEEALKTFKSFVCKKIFGYKKTASCFSEKILVIKNLCWEKYGFSNLFKLLTNDDIFINTQSICY